MAPMVYDFDGLKLTESYEGLKLTAYKDVRGIWTIGYGHTGPDVHQGLVIEPYEAQTFLRRDVVGAALCVNRHVSYLISQHKFDALVDFCFNIGDGAFAKSDVLQLVNSGSLAAAADAFLHWDKSGGRVFDGLVRRRTGERALFLA